MTQAKLGDWRFPIYIHGPQGCGKTRSSEKIKKFFGAEAVVDLESARQVKLAVYAHSGRVVFLLNDTSLLETIDERRKGSVLRFEDVLPHLK